jgi:exopolysaccharide production protein ExoZ
MNDLPPSLSLAKFISHDTTVNMLLLQHGCLFAVGLWLWIMARRVSVVRILGFGLACLFSLAEITATGIEVLRRHASAPESLWIPAAIWLVALAVIAVSLFKPLTRPVPILRSVGLMTYPLYLVHTSIGVVVLALLDIFSVMGALITAVGLSIGTAWLISLYGERTNRNLLKPLLDRTLGVKRA